MLNTGRYFYVVHSTVLDIGLQVCIYNKQKGMFKWLRQITYNSWSTNYYQYEEIFPQDFLVILKHFEEMFPGYYTDKVYSQTSNVC